MDIRTMKLFAEYNRRTNTVMNEIIGKIGGEQWNKEFSGYFRSVRSLCNHIYICDFNWLKRFGKLRDFTYIRDTFFERAMPFDSMALEDTGDYIAKRREMDERIIDFSSEITDDDIRKTLTYTDSHGKEYGRVFGGLILHFFNHQTHHRGMISIYLEHMGIDNSYSDLMCML